MRQFVGQQLLALPRAWCVLSTSKENVLPGSEGPRLQRPAERIRRPVRMHPNAAEVRSERALHRAANGIGQLRTAPLRSLDLLLHMRFYLEPALRRGTLYQRFALQLAFL